MVVGPGGRPPLAAAAGPTWVAVAREAKPPAGRISLDPRDPSSPRSVVGLFFSTTHTKFLALHLARTCTFNFRNEVAGQFEVMAAGLRPMAGNAWGFHADSLVDATSVLSPSRGALTMTGGGSAGSLGMSRNFGDSFARLDATTSNTQNLMARDLKVAGQVREVRGLPAPNGPR